MEWIEDAVKNPVTQRFNQTEGSESGRRSGRRVSFSVHLASRRETVHNAFFDRVLREVKNESEVFFQIQIQHWLSFLIVKFPKQRR